MSNPDAATLAQFARKLGLLNDAQLQESLEFVAEHGPDPLQLQLFLERKNYLTPWQTSKLQKGDYDGYFLGGYRVQYKVASGSFGRVYRAEDPNTGRIVAIKVLRRRWSEDKVRIDLFEREGKVGLSLRHPNIVEILDVKKDPDTGQWYIVMEFVEGGNLREILAPRKKLEVDEALRIVEDAANGLSYAFSRGVTHRDIKLTNLLISTKGDGAKLVDFGLARILSTGAKEEDKVDRTVDYAGLEKATGVKYGDVRSDIYFLGCVLYEILSGRPPLAMTRDKHQRMHKHRFEDVVALRPEDVKAPPSVFRLLETMISLNPAHRFQTPAQLLDAVRSCRRDVEGHKEDKPGDVTRSVFVAEADERLQEKLRLKLRELGYRVFMAADPLRAKDRFRQQPFDALVVDAGSTGEDGLHVFQHLRTDAERLGLELGCLLVLNEEQATWAGKVKPGKNVAVFVRPAVTLKQIYRRLQELVPTAPKGPADA
jgi:eukaryotic-like serine/threonine-protein kinase